ncbi:hypothetical protein Q8A73_022284 [Channa argus]|nr:hypothetical protein Q8A73_022284 [Channa argus]
MRGPVWQSVLWVWAPDECSGRSLDEQNLALSRTARLLLSWRDPVPAPASESADVCSVLFCSLGQLLSALRLASMLNLLWLLPLARSTPHLVLSLYVQVLSGGRGQLPLHLVLFLFLHLLLFLLLLVQFLLTAHPVAVLQSPNSASARASDPVPVTEQVDAGTSAPVLLRADAGTSAPIPVRVDAATSGPVSVLVDAASGPSRGVCPGRRRNLGPASCVDAASGSPSSCSCPGTEVGGHLSSLCISCLYFPRSCSCLLVG